MFKSSKRISLTLIDINDLLPNSPKYERIKLKYKNVNDCFFFLI